MTGIVRFVDTNIASYFDRTGTPLEQDDYLRLRADDDYRVVARDVLAPGGAVVLTVWFGTNQGPDPGAEPLIFGTAARLPGAGDLFENAEVFTSSETDALREHDRLLARLTTLLG